MSSLTTQNKKQFSSKQERTVADALGWSVVGGSGARLTEVGDVRSDEWLCECKTHTSPNHAIAFNLSVWAKLRNEAAAKFKYPVLIVDDGSQLLSRTWCMFRLNVFDLVKDTVAVVGLPINRTININFKYDELPVEVGTKRRIYTCLYDNVFVGITSFDTFKSLVTGEA